MRNGFVAPSRLPGQLERRTVQADALAHALRPDATEDEDEDGDDNHPPSGRRLRSVFISDVHLGTPGCQAKALLAFLKAHPSDRLYLIGDIVDGWQLRRKWYWPQSHNDVIQKILRRARKGCKVIFVPGNHDEFARHFLGHQFGGVDVVEDAIHTTADGRKFWIIHGDHFDGVIHYAKWLAYLGDNLYELTLRINTHFNSCRARLGLPYWSLSQYLKHRVKSALNYVLQFEGAVAAEARKRGLDGVICGHIHRAEMRDIDGTLYCNDGDWVESLTGIVEHQDGRLEIIHWGQPGAKARRAQVAPPGFLAPCPVGVSFEPDQEPWCKHENNPPEAHYENGGVMAAQTHPIDLFELLDDTHRQVQVQLGHLRALVDKIEKDGLDAEARALACKVLAFFNHDARQHHLDEEKHVFPSLLASKNSELEAAARRLIQDHGWLEENWLHIEPSIAAASQGNQWFDPTELRHALDVFEALYTDHLLLEESLVYPHAKQQLLAYDQLGRGREMARRRSAKTLSASE